MSGLVFDETKVIADDVERKIITINRIQSINSGVRIWYVIWADDGIMYERWSMLMNPTDKMLLLAQPGDKLVIDFIENHVEDQIHEQFESFDRLLILKAAFVVKE